MSEYIYNRAIQEINSNDIEKISKTRADRLVGALYELLIIARDNHYHCLPLLYNILDDVLVVYDKRFSRSKCGRNGQ